MNRNNQSARVLAKINTEKSTKMNIKSKGWSVIGSQCTFIIIIIISSIYKKRVVSSSSSFHRLSVQYRECTASYMGWGRVRIDIDIEYRRMITD